MDGDLCNSAPESRNLFEDVLYISFSLCDSSAGDNLNIATQVRRLAGFRATQVRGVAVDSQDSATQVRGIIERPRLRCGG